ncbi:MAG TPA: hypothetical protein VFE40_05115 [Jatrophihabitantaceae bacterium]|jgi:hypothetical protein|nr:hypothetical protein [Jatrophihabitantaceae bacterium]
MGRPPEPPYGAQPYWEQPQGDPQYVPQPPPYPQQYPGQPYPQGYQGYPPAPGYPQPGYPQPGYPQPGYPQPGYPYPGFGYPAPDGRRVSDPVLGWLTVGAALLAVLGGVLPWATVFGVSVYSSGGDGALVIGCAVIAGACGIAIGLARGRLWASITVTVFGLLIGLIGLVDTVNVNAIASNADVPPGIASVGAGLWLTIVAGLLITGLGAVAIVRRRPVGAAR